MLTTALDLAGAALIVVGCAVVFGVGAALLAGGAACLALSWALTPKGDEKP